MKGPVQAIGLFVLLILVPSQRASAEQVVTLTGDPWPPYVLGEIGSDATSGTGVQLIQEIFSLVEDAQVRFPLLPWNRALIAVEEGSMDGIGILLKSKERERYLVYTEPLFTSYDLAWYSTRAFPGGLRWKSIEDLTPYTIGVVSGYSYSDEIDAAIEGERLSVIKAPNARQLFRMLAGGRIDMAFANNFVGCSLASRNRGTLDVAAADRKVATATYYLGFSRKSPALSIVPEVNRAIVRLRENGEIDRILRSGAEGCAY